MTTLLSGKKTHVLFGDHEAIVLENGSYSTKLGFAGKDVPDLTQPTVLGLLVDIDGEHHIEEGIFVYKIVRL